MKTIIINYLNTKKEFKSGLSNCDYLNMIEVRIERNESIVPEYYYYFSLEG